MRELFPPICPPVAVAWSRYLLQGLRGRGRRKGAVEGGGQEGGAGRESCLLLASCAQSH